MHWRAWLVLVAVGLAGCGGDNGAPFGGRTGGDETTTARTSTSDRDARPGLVPQTRPPVRDLAVPVGFELDESVSRHYASGDMRVVDHSYTGRADRFQLSRFYESQMPRLGWSLHSSQMVGGTYTMRFEKSDEFCEIRVTSGRGAFGGTTSTVVVHIQPLARANR